MDFVAEVRIVNIHLESCKKGYVARPCDQIVKVARTIADLAGAENILNEHISEAVQ